MPVAETIELSSFLDMLTKACYPTTHELPKTHCLECAKQAYDPEKGYTPEMFRTQDGMQEFHISQLCELCWEELMQGEE